MNCKNCGTWLVETIEQWVGGVCHACGAFQPLDMPEAQATAERARVRGIPESQMFRSVDALGVTTANAPVFVEKAKASEPIGFDETPEVASNEPASKESSEANDTSESSAEEAKESMSDGDR